VEREGPPELELENFQDAQLHLQHLLLRISLVRDVHKILHLKQKDKTSRNAFKENKNSSWDLDGSNVVSKVPLYAVEIN
jgi:hypothetical protein